MAVMHARNRFRQKKMLVAREFKAVFKGIPSLFLPLLTRWIWRWLFIGPDGKPHRAGEVVLADLRSFCREDQPSNFHSDPQIMARREGRREVFKRIINYLNLDEATVQKLMELDDGN